MPAYAYRAYLANGARENGVVEATTKQEAARKLAQQGRRSYHLVPASEEKAQIRLPGKTYFTLTRRVDLSRLLASFPCCSMPASPSTAP